MKIFVIRYQEPNSENIYRTECFSELEQRKKAKELIQKGCTILKQFEDNI